MDTARLVDYPAGGAVNAYDSQRKRPPSQQSSGRYWPIGVVIWLTLYFVLIIYATYAHLFFGAYDANIALRGFSALDFTNFVLFPENFERDYPGGSWSVGNSLLPWVYPLFTQVGIDVEITLIVFTSLEMIVLTTGAMYLAQVVFRNVHPVVLIGISALLVLSWIRASNLALRCL